MALPDASQPARPLPWPAIGLGSLVLLALLAALAFFGQLGSFLLNAFNVLPFLGLVLLAQLGERHQWARVLAYLCLILFGLVILLISLAMVMAGAMGGELSRIERLPPELLVGALLTMALFLGLGLLGLALSWALLIPAVRRVLATRLPIRAESTTHAIALSLTLTLGLLPILALAVLGGRPPFLTLIASTNQSLNQIGPLDQVYPFVWLLPASIILVGYPLQRRFGEALARLGLVRPTGAQIAIGLAAAVILVGLATAVDQGIAGLFNLAGWPRTDVKAFEELMKGLITPIGAVVIGITAGLGEEIAIRGVLQPRVGLLLANLAFTSLHAFQYGFDGLLSVFFIGLVLGLLRQRTNTSTAAITHGTYDFILVMASALGFG